jgi:superfamily II DNA or RNA helicase
MIPLRPYQEAGIEAVRSRMRTGKRRIVFVLATGGGKTVCACAIISGAIEKGSRALFCAHRRELIAQTFTKLLRSGLPFQQIGIVMAGTPPHRPSLFRETPLDIIARMTTAGFTDKAIDRELWGMFGARRPQAPIQVASIDTARDKELGDFDLVIIDECHRARAASYVKLILKYRARARVLGLTATPFPAGGLSLGDIVEGEALFDDLVPPAATARELAEMGYLVTPRMFGVPPSSLPDLSEVRVTKDGDWNQEDLEKASNTKRLVGDIVAHWKQRGEGLRTVVFAAGVKHSREIVAAFGAAGVHAEHLDGETPTETRDAILARLDSGQTTVVSQCDVLTEGWDQPSVAVLIFARSTRSRRLAKQMMGRGLRPHPDKPFTLFLDHAGVIAEHDGPLAEEDFSIDPSKKKRSGGEVSIKMCPKCFAIVPSTMRVCDGTLPDGALCGHRFGEASERDPIAQEDGELIEIRDVPRAEKRAAFDALCAERGDRKPGWVFQRFFERFNVRPPKAWKVPLHDHEKPENNLDVMDEWRGVYRSGHAKGDAPKTAAGRFKAVAGFWPNRVMLDEQREFVEAQKRAEAGGQGPTVIEEQLRASVRIEAPPLPQRRRAPRIPDLSALEVYPI